LIFFDFDRVLFAITKARASIGGLFLLVKGYFVGYLFMKKNLKMSHWGLPNRHQVSRFHAALSFLLSAVENGHISSPR
jgi:hypothetical protein